ncbi:MAG: MFS transporter [Candidatus Hermodarchaeota archaeon]
MSINKFLGIQDLPSRPRFFIRSFLLLQVLTSFLMSLSNTFFILFSIDNIGFVLSSITVSIMFLVQLITDYPSGSLGDWIGQRWVLTISFACYGIAFFLMVSAQSFTSFAIIAIINGFGNAQNSGAAQSWLDNNYRKVIGDADPDRKIYGFSRLRTIPITRAVLAITFVIGGVLATIVSRQFVFFIQSFLSAFMIIVVLIIVKDEKIMDSEEISNKKTPENNYLKHLVGGLKFLFSTKSTFFFLMGAAFIGSTFAIWGSLLLFPIYFGYSGSDILAGFLRTTVFIFGIIMAIFMAKVSKRLNNNKFPHILFLYMPTFFLSFAALIYLIPPTNTFNPLGWLFVIILINGLTGTLFDIAMNLQQRIMLDLVPSEVRNSVYSLIPTLVSILGIFILPIAGLLIEIYGLIAGIMAALFVGIVSVVFITLGVYFMRSSSEGTRIEKSEMVDASSTAV